MKKSKFLLKVAFSLLSPSSMLKLPIFFQGDCRELLLTGNRASGVYTINPLNEVEFQVFCDHDTHGGGWTVIQRRGGNDVTNFKKSWSEYKAGTFCCMA